MRLQNLRAHLDILNDTLCFNKSPHIPDGASSKEPPPHPLPKKETQEMWVGKILGWEDSLELDDRGLIAVSLGSLERSRPLPFTK